MWPGLNCGRTIPDYYVARLENGLLNHVCRRQTLALVGATISRKIEAAEWGDRVGEQLLECIARTQPGLHGCSRANLFRMRQFCGAYNGDEKVAPVVRQLPWSHHLIILGQSKRPEEREFYIARFQSSNRAMAIYPHSRNDSVDIGV